MRNGPLALLALLATAAAAVRGEASAVEERRRWTRCDPRLHVESPAASLAVNRPLRAPSLRLPAALSAPAFDATRRSYQVEVPSPSRSVLSVRNVSPTPLTLQPASLSGVPVLHSLTDVHDEIAALPTEYPDHSLGTQVFRMVADNFYHAYPITLDYSWSLTPSLFFDSNGLSLCGDAAALVVNLANLHGLNARRWGLDGHVVAEILEGGRWKMYDADYGVYLVNRTGEIASVAELERDPDLIVNPLFPMPYNGKWNPYQAAYAELFTSVPNHVVGNVGPGLAAEPLAIEVPSGGRVVLPGRHAPAQVAIDGNPVPAWEDLKLVLPPGFSGELDVFLMLHEIRGDGSVSLAGVSYEIGSPALDAAIAANRGPVPRLEVIEARGRIEVIYLLNPLRFFMLPLTRVDLDVSRGQGVQVSLLERGVPGADSDGDGIGDDGDGDGVAGDRPCADRQLADCDDSCTFAANAGQHDADGDGVGNACDGDLDGDGRVDQVDAAVVEACILAGYGGNGPPEDASCLESDLDEDEVVDASDLDRVAELAWDFHGSDERFVAYASPVSPACGRGFLWACVPPLALSAGRRMRGRRRAPNETFRVLG